MRLREPEWLNMVIHDDLHSLLILSIFYKPVILHVNCRVNSHCLNEGKAEIPDHARITHTHIVSFSNTLRTGYCIDVV